MSIIEVTDLTKEYRLGTMNSLKQTALDAAARIMGKPQSKRALLKALNNVNFKVNEGEVIGIIGHNGAGKSTLLKMLANISKPSSGSVSVKGRIAPLIEVGAGFVPDFTGRENVFLNGAILGMTKKEIEKKFDEIIFFSEMEQFIDTPVKRYSSGMQVKLAFAVATSVDSEILIVDEVLAVGDLAFQRKCFDRMEDLIKRQGRTVLLVSHNLRHVERICDRVILMDHGAVIMDGNPSETCNLFYQQNDALITTQKKQAASFSAHTRTSGEVELRGVEIFDSSGTIITEVQHGEDVTFRIKYNLTKPLTKPVFVLGVHTTDFIYIGSSRSQTNVSTEELPAGLHEIDCMIDSFPFLPGVYALRLDVIVGSLYSTAFRAENVHPFNVKATTLSRVENDSEGFVPLNAQWTVDVGPDVAAP